MKLVWRVVILTFGVCIATACDKRPAPKPPATAPAPTEPVEPRPTTQELMSGTYKRLPLPGMPLALNAPQSWKIDIGQAFPATFVSGPSPFANVLIQLSQPDANTFKEDQINLIVSTAQKKTQEQPDMYRKAEVLQVGGMKVLETLTFQKPRTMPKVDVKGMGMVDEKGNLIMQTTQQIDWTLVAFVPAEQPQTFRRHQLKVFDLTAEQYEVDRPLLERVLHSISFDTTNAPEPAPSAVPSAPPGPVPPPMGR